MQPFFMLGAILRPALTKEDKYGQTDAGRQGKQAWVKRLCFDRLTTRAILTVFKTLYPKPYSLITVFNGGGERRRIDSMDRTDDLS